MLFFLFDLFRVFGLKRLVYHLAILEYRFFKTGFHFTFYEYFRDRGENELCDKLMERYIFLFIENPRIESLKTEDFSGKLERDLQEGMRIFFETTEQAGFRPFLAFGTLLGFVRENKFIPWDTDLDVGFFYDETDIGELISVLEKAGFSIVENTGTVFPCKLKFRLGSLPLIDVAFFKSEEDKLVTYSMMTDGPIFRRRSSFALKETEFYKVPVRIPDKPELFLTENYGDWEVPRHVYHYILDSKLTDYRSNPDIRHLARVVFLTHLRRDNRPALIHYINFFNIKLPEDTLWQKVKHKMYASNYLHENSR